MFCSVKSIALAASVSVAALATAAYAQDGSPSYSEIEVTASFSEVDDSNAMEIFPDIENDLRAAISEKLPRSDDAADPIISVDVRSIALNGNPLMTSTEGFNEIEGVVSISDPNTRVVGTSFPVNIAAYPAEQTVPEGYIAVAPSADDFYRVMIDGFAETVADQATDVTILEQNRDR